MIFIRLQKKIKRTVGGQQSLRTNLDNTEKSDVEEVLKPLYS